VSQQAQFSVATDEYIGPGKEIAEYQFSIAANEYIGQGKEKAEYPVQWRGLASVGGPACALGQDGEWAGRLTTPAGYFVSPQPQ
jgi:hypothetical protein